MPKASTVEYRITIRVTTEVAQRADDLLKHLSSVRGQVVTRSDVLREAMIVGLVSLEREARKT